EAAVAPWQNSVAHEMSKIFFWMSLSKVEPFVLFWPFGFWQTKAKRWLPCAPSTFMASCAFFFAPSTTVTVAGAVQMVPGVDFNLSSSPMIGPSPGADAMVVPARSAASQAALLDEKQRLVRMSHVPSGLPSSSHAASPSTHFA